MSKQWRPREGPWKSKPLRSVRSQRYMWDIQWAIHEPAVLHNIIVAGMLLFQGRLSSSLLKTDRWVRHMCFFSDHCRGVIAIFSLDIFRLEEDVGQGKKNIINIGWWASEKENISHTRQLKMAHWQVPTVVEHGDLKYSNGEQSTLLWASWLLFKWVWKAGLYQDSP